MEQRTQITKAMSLRPLILISIMGILLIVAQILFVLNFEIPESRYDSLIHIAMIFIYLLFWIYTFLFIRNAWKDLEKESDRYMDSVLKTQAEIAEAEVAANERIKESTERMFQRTVNGYTTVMPVSTNVAFKNGVSRYALYPVWLLTIKHKDKDHIFAMNGQTGKFVGNIPTDTKKVKTLGVLIGAGIGVALWAVLNLIGLI